MPRKHQPIDLVFGFYLQSEPGHIVEIAEVTTMVPSIPHARLAAGFPSTGRLALPLLLLLLSGAFFVNGKEKADDIAVPTFSVPAGVYTNDLKVAIQASTDLVRFSLDGSEPGPESAVYKEPLQITNCAIVRAKAWTADGRASRTVTQSYTLLAEDLLGFSSNLPLVIVKSCEGEIAPAEKSLGALRIVTNAPAAVNRVSLTGAADFEGLTLLNVRGHSSLRYPKHSYTMKVVNEMEDAQKVSVLGMPKESDWVLYGPYPDKTFMRDVLAYELSNKMGRWAPQTRLVEVFVSENGAKLGMENYAGVYVLEEKITRDKNRVNIAKLNPSENREPEITGGYIFKKDHTGRFERKRFEPEGPAQAGTTTNRAGYPTPAGGFPADPAGFFPSYKANTNRVVKPPTRTTSTRPPTPKKPKADPNRPRTNYVAAAAREGIKVSDETIFHEDEYFRSTLQRNQFYYYEPEADEITPVQRAWLKDFVNRLEAGLYGANFTNATSGYRAFIDADSFIDYHLLVEVTKNVDAFRFSTFYYKDRGGRLNMGPAWDWNLSFGNADGKQGWMPDHWLWPQLDDTQYSWFRRLFEDPDFAQRYVDRWAQLRTNVFAASNILARIDELARLLNESQERNFAKWEIMGRHVTPNYHVADSFPEEIEWMKNWITNRLTWIENQFVAAPNVKVGSAIELSTTAGARPDGPGKIYFTLDGTDPRAPGGGVSSKAQLYDKPISAGNAKLFARVQSGSRWSAPLKRWF